MLRSTLLMVAFGLFPGITDSHPAGSTARPDPEALVGTWVVDLRPTPDAAPYLQEFVVTSVANGQLEGTFYGSSIEEGRINTDWGLVRFAFVTTDGAGVYHTSGRLDGGRLEGLTHSLGRDFLSYWTAEGPAAR